MPDRPTPADYHPGSYVDAILNFPIPEAIPRAPFELPQSGRAFSPPTSSLPARPPIPAPSPGPLPPGGGLPGRTIPSEPSRGPITSNAPALPPTAGGIFDPGIVDIPRTSPFDPEGPIQRPNEPLRFPPVPREPGGGPPAPGLPPLGPIIARVLGGIIGALWPSPVAPGTLEKGYVDEAKKAWEEFQRRNRPIQGLEKIELPETVKRRPFQRSSAAPTPPLEAIIVTAKRLPVPTSPTKPAAQTAKRTRPALPRVPAPIPAPVARPFRLPSWTSIIASVVASRLTPVGTSMLPSGSGFPTGGQAPEPFPQPMPQPGGSGLRSPISTAVGLCEEMQQRRSKKRKRKRRCKEMANVVWSGGPKKGKLAGRKCFTYLELK